MRPLLNSADAHASFIEAVRLGRVACVRMSATGKVRFEANVRPNDAGADYHLLPVFDLTQLEPPKLTDSDMTTEDGQPSETLMARTKETMQFISEQLGKGAIAVPYDDAIYLEHNGRGTPVIWVISVFRKPDGEFLNLTPFRWAPKEQVWLLETAVAVPLLHGSGKVWFRGDDEYEYDAWITFHHFGDLKQRYRPDALGKHEHEFRLRMMAVLITIQRMIRAAKGETVVVEGTHEAMRINARRDRLGLPKLQPVVRIISLTPRARWVSGLPSEPTGRTVEAHRRRGTIVTNRFGTQFPRRATIVNDPARTRTGGPLSLPTPWYEVQEELRDGRSC